jgi:hypothetical protein
MKKCACMLMAILFLAASACLAEEPWVLVKDSDSIKVYSRPVPGAGFKEFKGIGDVKAPLEVVSKVFEDIPSFPSWFGFCLESKQLKHDTVDTWQVYIVIKVPGGGIFVSDRDVVTDVVRERKPGKITLTLNAVKDDPYPNKGKYVRMTEMTGVIVMTGVDETTTNIVYTMKPNPAGHIPGWISNIVQKDQPYLTIKGMREMVKKDTYYLQAGIPRKK